MTDPSSNNQPESMATNPANSAGSPTPALLRPPVPSTRSSPGPRAPRLGLAIPPSPHARPLANAPNIVPEPQRNQRPLPPQLRLATPMGTKSTPQEGRARNGRLPPLQINGLSASGSSDTCSDSRSGSFGDGHANGSTSAASSHSNVNYANILLPPLNTADPPSAAGSNLSAGGSEAGAAMERESSTGVLPDLNQLSLDIGRPVDIEDLDDAGWKAASRDSRIVELGSLGEGAGGAVTRCILKDGKTVFALKVSY